MADSRGFFRFTEYLGNPKSSRPTAGRPFYMSGKSAQKMADWVFWMFDDLMDNRSIDPFEEEVFSRRGRRAKNKR